MRGCRMMKFFASRRCERGYTLQTMVLVAVLTAGAVVGLVVLYGVLSDSSEVIGGGAQSADGLPGEPRNVVVGVSAGGSEGELDVVVSWEAPAFFGEYALAGYVPEVHQMGGDGDVGVAPMCDHGLLESGADNFSGGNRCEWDDLTVMDGEMYEFVLGLLLRGVQGERVEVEHRYAVGDPPMVSAGGEGNLQVLGGQEAMVVRWTSGSLVEGGTGGGEATVYRFRIARGGEDGAADYVLCVPARWLLPGRSKLSEVASGIDNELVQLPYLAAQTLTAAGGGGEVSDPANMAAGSWPLVIYQSGPETYPAPGVSYDIELAVSTVSIRTDQGAYQLPRQPADFCQDAGNFPVSDTALFQGSYGIPETPRFVVDTVQTGGLTLPQVRVVSYPCTDVFPNDAQQHQNMAGKVEFTFFWTTASQPEQPEQSSFSACRKTLPVAAPAGGTDVKLWAIAANPAGGSRAAGLVSGESAPVSWSAQPAPPAPIRLQARWSAADGSPGTDQVDFFWQAPPTGDAPAALPANHYAYTIATGSTLCASQTELPTSSGTAGVVPAHAMRTPRQAVPDTAGGIACVEVRAVAGNRASQPVRLVTTPPETTLFTLDDANLTIITWQTSQLSNLTHFTAQLTLDDTCEDPDETLLTKHIPATRPANNPNGPFTASFPLTQTADGGGLTGYICLAEHYTDHTSHIFHITTLNPPKAPPYQAGWQRATGSAPETHAAIRPYFNETPTEEFWLCAYTQPEPIRNFNPRNIAAILITPADVDQTYTSDQGSFPTTAIYDHNVEVTGNFRVWMWLATSSACIFGPGEPRNYINGRGGHDLPQITSLNLSLESGNLQASGLLSEVQGSLTPYNTLDEAYLCFDMNWPGGNEGWQDRPAAPTMVNTHSVSAQPSLPISLSGNSPQH